MKKLALLSILGIFICSYGFSQVKVVEKNKGKEEIININELKDVSVVQIVGMGNLLGTKIKIYVDYGQDWDLRNDSYVIDNETGEKVKFESMIHALNYMEKYGWAYLDAYTLSTGSGLVYHYLFKRITPQQ